MAWKYSPSNIQNTLGQYASQQNTTKNVMQGYLSGVKGSNFDFLQELLKDRISGQNPLFDKLAGNAKRRIGDVTNENIREIKEQSAQSGFRGIGANQINKAYKSGQSAMAGVEDSLINAQLSQSQNAINSLLGLNQFEGAANMGLFNSSLNQANFNRQMDFQEEQAGTDFMDVLGSILGMGAGALGGGYLGTLGSKWA